MECVCPREWNAGKIPNRTNRRGSTSEITQGCLDTITNVISIHHQTIQRGLDAAGLFAGGVRNNRVDHSRSQRRKKRRRKTGKFLMPIFRATARSVNRDLSNSRTCTPPVVGRGGKGVTDNIINVFHDFPLGQKYTAGYYAHFRHSPVGRYRSCLGR